MTVCLSANGDVVHRAAERPTELLLATATGLVRLHRQAGKVEWHVGERTLQGKHPAALIRIPGTDTLIVGLHYSGGLMKSLDNGASWQHLDADLASDHVYCLAVQPLDNALRIYAGTEPPMLYASDDFGKSWHNFPAMWNVPDTDKWRFPPPPHVAHLKNITFHPDRPDTIFMCVEQGDLLRSDDAGQSWRSLTSYEKAEDQFRRDLHRVVFKPSSPDKFFLASGVGLYYTEDGGETFDHVHQGNGRVGYPDCLFLHPDDENTVYIGGAERAPNPTWSGTGSANPALLRSRDSGKTWEQLHTGLPDRIPGNVEAMAVCAWNGGFSLFMGTSTGDVYLSDDAGESWNLIASGLQPVSKGAHYRHFATPETRKQIEDELRAGALV